MNEELVIPTEQHIRELAETMAPEDAAEVWATAHETPYEALSFSVRTSDDPKAWIVDGRVICMFGVSRDTALSVGIPWFLASSDLPKYSRRFLRCAKWFVDDWRREYPYMHNAVDARHKRAVRWIEWLGFTLYPAEPLGPDGIMFHRFEMVN